MKNLLSFAVVVLLLSFIEINAQQKYDVDGEQYDLFTEIEGPLTLLWNSIDDEYRYFSKKGNDISELKNTKTEGDYREEYKETLRLQTQDSPIDLSNLKFTLPGLRSFFVAYNKALDPNYEHETESIKLKTRLGIFGGFFNNAYFYNPTNALAATAGIDFEIIDNVKLKRHTIVFRFKQSFENSETKSSSSQFSLNYRFKFVKSTKFDAFINTKFAAFTYSKAEIIRETTDPNDLPVYSIVEESGGNFDVPVAFGLGVDYAIGNGYITFCYNDIVALGIENENGNFPVDFSLGYKFNL